MCPLTFYWAFLRLTKLHFLHFKIISSCCFTAKMKVGFFFSDCQTKFGLLEITFTRLDSQSGGSAQVPRGI